MVYQEVRERCKPKSNLTRLAIGEAIITSQADLPIFSSWSSSVFRMTISPSIQAFELGCLDTKSISMVDVSNLEVKAKPGCLLLCSVLICVPAHTPKPRYRSRLCILHCYDRRPKCPAPIYGHTVEGSSFWKYPSPSGIPKPPMCSGPVNRRKGAQIKKPLIGYRVSC